MRNTKWLIYALPLALCLFAVAQAQSILVEDVELRGYRSITAEELRKHIKTTPGEKYDEAQVKRDFQQILALGIFDRAKSKFVIEEGPRGGMVVIFDLKERPKRQ